MRRQYLEGSRPMRVGVAAYLVAVVPEEVVWFLPRVSHHTGQVEGAAQLYVDLSASHDLGSGL